MSEWLALYFYLCGAGWIMIQAYIDRYTWSYIIVAGVVFPAWPLIFAWFKLSELWIKERDSE